MFGRRRKRSEDAVDQVDKGVAAEELAEDTADDVADDSAEEAEQVSLPPAPRPDGPWDISEVGNPGEGRVDLGGLFVPGVEGMELRVEVAGDSIVAATVVLRDSAVQLQGFAAP
ncbi:DUF3710 domain-containing protein, partial [Streptomyces sp. AC627_RSS907]